jgi:LSD1 subclass zinc finger protein
MAEIIFCPTCRRRLQLPGDFQAEWVRCPACQTDFEVSPTGVVLAPQESLPPIVLPADSEQLIVPSRPAPVRPSPQLQRRSQKTSRSACFIVFLVLGLVGLIISVGVAGILVLVWRSPSESKTPTRFLEDDEEKFEQLREAFRNQPPIIEGRIVPELQPLFNDLGAALRRADADGVMLHFDTDRMTDEFGDLAVLPRRKTRARRQFIIGLRRGMGQSLVRISPAFQWTTSEIRKVKKLNDEECLVVVRHKHPDGSNLKVRWWLTRRAGVWKIYDFEDLDAGMRFSTTVASFAEQGAGRFTEIGRAGTNIGEAFQALIANDIDTAENKLKLMPPRLPLRLEAMRLLLTGIVHIHRGKDKEALQALEAAKRLHADMPVADYLRGIVLKKMSKWEEALKYLNDYRNLLGDDDEVCREIGETLRQLRRFREAAIEYRKALDVNPQDAEAFDGLLSSLEADDNKDDLGPRFAKLENHREHFDEFARDCEERQFPQLLEPLVRTMRRLDPDYPPVDFYDALVNARTGHPEEAVRLIRSALRKQTEQPKHKEYGRQFLKVMAVMGHFKEAYPVLPDARESFLHLASELLTRYRLDDLKALTALHRQKQADDPLLPLYEAEIHVREGRYAEADKCFSDGVKRGADAETLQTFRASRVLARHHIGQTLSAYREIGPRDETFLQLANLCYNAEDDTTLEALLDAHAKIQPKNADVPRFRARLNIRQNKTAQGIALFKTTLTKRIEKEKREELVAEFLRDMVQAGKPLEAYRAAPDARQAFQIVAGQLLSQTRFDELRLLIPAHRAADPADPWLAYYRGELYLQDKEWTKAADVLAQGMKRATKEQRDGFRRNYVYAMYKAGRALQAYAVAEPHDSTFDQLANLMTNDKKGVELEELIRLHRPHAGDDSDLLYRECRAKLLRKKHNEAIALFVLAYKRDKLDYRRINEVRDFLLTLIEDGRFAEGWRAVPDKTVAFTTLAPNLVSQKKQKDLADLLDEYAKDHEDDVTVAFYRGELALLRGEAKEAARHFAIAVEKGSKQEQWRNRDGLFRARIALGEATAVYEQFHTDADTFDRLALLCQLKKDAVQLQALLAAHRQRKPDDPASIVWEWELRWLKQDYDGALRLLKEHRDVFSLPRYQWKTQAYLVRCLLKLKRNQEAVREAEAAVKKTYGDRFFLILAYASAGDVPRTLATVEKTSYSRTYLLHRCYGDADLGPILRSEAFQAFREKFPEPKNEPISDRGDRDFDD